MFNLNKDIYNILNDISTYDVESDDLPLNFDFNKNKVGIYYQINSVEDGSYKVIGSLDVNFYCLAKNESDVLKAIDLFDDRLNKLDIYNYWITHKNIYLVKIIEDELIHYVLTYNVNKY